jgi:hypothetical protein
MLEQYSQIQQKRTTKILSEKKKETSKKLQKSPMGFHFNITLVK